MRGPAGALLIDHPSWMILLVERVYDAVWSWGLPGGIIEADESPLGACRREIREELGIDLIIEHLADTTVVVFHTAVLTHFTPHARAAFEQQLHQLCTLRPITWIQGEPRPDQQPRLRLAQLANARIQTELLLGRYRRHGAWLEWVNTEIPQPRPTLTTK